MNLADSDPDDRAHGSRDRSGECRTKGISASRGGGTAMAGAVEGRLRLE